MRARQQAFQQAANAVQSAVRTGVLNEAQGQQSQRQLTDSFVRETIADPTATRSAQPGQSSVAHPPAQARARGALGTETNPWIIDNFAVDEAELPAVTTTNQSVPPPRWTRSLSELMGHRSHRRPHQRPYRSLGCGKSQFKPISVAPRARGVRGADWRSRRSGGDALRDRAGNGRDPRRADSPTMTALSTIGTTGGWRFGMGLRRRFPGPHLRRAIYGAAGGATRQTYLLGGAGRDARRLSASAAIITRSKSSTRRVDPGPTVADAVVSMADLQREFGNTHRPESSTIGGLGSASRWCDWLTRYGPMILTVEGDPAHAVVITGLVGSGDTTTSFSTTVGSERFEFRAGSGRVQSAQSWLAGPGRLRRISVAASTGSTSGMSTAPPRGPYLP